jgi:hypothetical protein
MIDMFFKPASHWPASRALWAIRALIGRYAEGGTGVNFFLHLNLVSISFDYWQNINKKRFKKTPTYNSIRALSRVGAGKDSLQYFSVYNQLQITSTKMFTNTVSRRL